MAELQTYISILWVYITITLALVVNRLYVKGTSRADAFSSRRPGTWSDVLIGIAWIIFSGLGVTESLSASKRQIYYLSDPYYLAEEHFQIWVKAAKIGYATNVLSPWPSLYCVKAAILLFYLELTPPPRIRRATIFGLSVVAVIGIFSSTYTFFICPKSSFFWSRGYRDDDWSGCHGCRFAIVTIVGLHIITDIYSYIIPFFIVRHVDIRSWSERLAIYGMFGAGFLLLLCTLPYVIEFFYHPVFFNHPLWNHWRIIHEQALAITVACLPALRITFNRYFNKSVRSANGGGEKKTKKKIQIGKLSFARRLQRGVLTTVEVANSRVRPTSNRGNEPRDAGVHASHGPGHRHAGVGTSMNDDCDGNDSSSRGSVPGDGNV